jgi:glutathione S-transferase
MPDIKLFELGPTRSARCRWTLLEAGLEYESIGNNADILGSEALREVHPLGKLPAAIIDGRPLFESAAIATAIADLVPEQALIAKPGSWSRALHDQWVCFALTELEAWVWSAELNSTDFVFPKSEQVPAIIPQNEILFKRSAAALDAELAETDYLIENRFTVTDIIVGYTISFGDELGWINDSPNLLAYLERLMSREHCTLVRHKECATNEIQ